MNSYSTTHFHDINLYMFALAVKK